MLDLMVVGIGWVDLKNSTCMCILRSSIMSSKIANRAPHFKELASEKYISSGFGIWTNHPELISL